MKKLAIVIVVIIVFVIARQLWLANVHGGTFTNPTGRK